MPLCVHCPSCGRSGRVPAEYLHRKVRCKHCRTSFLVADQLEEEAADILTGTERTPAYTYAGYTDDMPL